MLPLGNSRGRRGLLFLCPPCGLPKGIMLAIIGSRVLNYTGPWSNLEGSFVLIKSKVGPAMSYVSSSRLKGAAERQMCSNKCAPLPATAMALEHLTTSSCLARHFGEMLLNLQWFLWDRASCNHQCCSGRSPGLFQAAKWLELALIKNLGIRTLALPSTR